MLLTVYRALWGVGFLLTLVSFGYTFLDPDIAVICVFVPFAGVLALASAPVVVDIFDGYYEMLDYHRSARRFLDGPLPYAAVAFTVIHGALFVVRVDGVYISNAALFFLFMLLTVALKLALKHKYPIPGIDYV